MDNSLKAQDKVIEICEKLNADTYINPIGGMDLYSKQAFSDKHISLSFIQSKEIRYQQFENEFMPWLSIIDLLMFNSKDVIRNYLNDYRIH